LGFVRRVRVEGGYGGPGVVISMAMPNKRFRPGEYGLQLRINNGKVIPAVHGVVPVKDARHHCGRDDCVAGVVGLELRNPCAIYVLEMS
jgi:hypothetical protein